MVPGEGVCLPFVWTIGLLYVLLGVLRAVGSRSVGLYRFAVLRIHDLRGRHEMLSLFLYANVVVEDRDLPPSVLSHIASEVAWDAILSSFQGDVPADQVTSKG